MAKGSADSSGVGIVPIESQASQIRRLKDQVSRLTERAIEISVEELLAAFEIFRAVAVVAA